MASAPKCALSIVVWTVKSLGAFPRNHLRVQLHPSSVSRLAQPDFHFRFCSAFNIWDAFKRVAPLALYAITVRAYFQIFATTRGVHDGCFVLDLLGHSTHKGPITSHTFLFFDEPLQKKEKRRGCADPPT